MGKGLKGQLDKEKEKSGEVDITKPRTKEKSPAIATKTKTTPATKTNNKKAAGAKSKEEPKNEEPLTATPDLIKELMETVKKQGLMIAELTKAQQTAPVAQKEVAKTYDQKVFDDYMEEPVVFFAFSNYYSILGYKLRGEEVLAPKGIIRFQPLYRYVSKISGRQKGQNEVISVCQVVINSRKEYEFLKNSPLYKIKFFETMNEATNVDTYLAEKMTQMSNHVAQLNDFQVIERCKTLDISIKNPDFKVLRQRLIDKMARTALKQDADKRNRIASKTIEEKTTITDAEIEKMKQADPIEFE